MGPEGEYCVPALQSNYSLESLGEGEIGRHNFSWLLQFNTPVSNKIQGTSSLNKQTEPWEGAPKGTFCQAKSLTYSGRARTESEAKLEQYSRQLTTKYGMRTNLSEQTPAANHHNATEAHPRGYQLQTAFALPKKWEGLGC